MYCKQNVAGEMRYEVTRDKGEERDEVTREEDADASRGVTTIIIGLVIYHFHIFFT
jgi:hypothetical protein